MQCFPVASLPQSSQRRGSSGCNIGIPCLHCSGWEVICGFGSCWSIVNGSLSCHNLICQGRDLATYDSHRSRGSVGDQPSLVTSKDELPDEDETLGSLNLSTIDEGWDILIGDLCIQQGGLRGQQGHKSSYVPDAQYQQIRHYRRTMVSMVCAWSLESRQKWCSMHNELTFFQLSLNIPG